MQWIAGDRNVAAAADSRQQDSPRSAGSRPLPFPRGDMMSTLHKEIRVNISAEEVWSAVRDVGALHTRLVPGFVVDTAIEGSVRTVRFGNGMVIREPIISIDDTRRRLAWTAEGGQLRHYNAVMEVVPEGQGCRVLWTSDLLPDEAAPNIAALQEQGLATLKATMERRSSASTTADSSQGSTRS